MIPAPFDYEVASSPDHAVALLGQHGEDAKVLAGGHSLLPLMRLRLAAPSVLIDVGRLRDLNYVRANGDTVAIGALSTHEEVHRSEVLREHVPILAHTAGEIGDPQVRHRGTIGGSVAHADPQGDWGAVMLACGAEFVARRSGSDRTIAADDFFVDLFTSALEPDELLTEIHVPRYDGPAGGAYLKLERKVGDYATVGVAVHLQLDSDRTRIGHAGIALTAVGPKNIKAIEAEQMLTGQPPGDELFTEAADRAAAAAEPRTDVRGSAEFKRSVVRTFVQRGLARAVVLAEAA
jgi:aerobic carbon-monoxide dehydrogenase medium subunit